MPGRSSPSTRPPQTDVVGRSPTMTSEELRRAREAQRRTPRELVDLLEMDMSSVYKIERDESARQHRPPPARAVRLIHAYLSGYMPDDWPERLRDLEAILS